MALPAEANAQYPPGYIERDILDAAAKHRAKGLEVRLDGHGRGFVEVDYLAVPEQQRGRGMARAALADLGNAADRSGVVLGISPSDFKGSSKSGLERLYRGAGFKSNKGRNKWFELRTSMVREPTRPVAAKPMTRMRRR